MDDIASTHDDLARVVDAIRGERAKLFGNARTAHTRLLHYLDDAATDGADPADVLGQSDAEFLRTPNIGARSLKIWRKHVPKPGADLPKRPLRDVPDRLVDLFSLVGRLQTKLDIPDDEIRPVKEEILALWELARRHA